MGLDTSHDCWHGAYSAFGFWRNSVARAAGYCVWKVKHDDVGYEMDTIMLHWGVITPANNMGEWERTPDDPLVVLFAHSDCEGMIYPEQATPLADALEALIPNLQELESRQPSTGHIAMRGGLAGCARKFIAGLRQAAAANEPVKFY